MQEAARAIASGDTTVTVGDKDMDLRDAAKLVASSALDAMAGERLRRALEVARAIAEYANLDDKEPPNA